jgi:hypothetical protein
MPIFWAGLCIRPLFAAFFGESAYGHVSHSLGMQIPRPSMTTFITSEQGIVILYFLFFMPVYVALLGLFWSATG